MLKTEPAVLVTASVTFLYCLYAVLRGLVDLWA